MSDPGDLRQVPAAEARAYADAHSMLVFFECSAKENTNVDELFSTVAVLLVERGLASSDAASRDSIASLRPSKKTQQGGCC